MNRDTRLLLAALVGAATAAATFAGLWRSYPLALGVFVVYAFGAWGFLDSFGDWPDTDRTSWVQASFPAFALTPALLGLPTDLPLTHRAALGVLVFGAAYGGIFLGVAWALRAARADADTRADADA